MIHYTKGNLLDADAEALVNTVNTVGIMGKGIALMFKERFPLNMALYKDACQSGTVKTGKVFVTETGELAAPRWIVNFPTKQHWRTPSKMEWIVEGLRDLKKWIIESNVKSIALPPLGAGNGGLNWKDVKPEIEAALSSLDGVKIYIYEPITKYQNIIKKEGIEELTPARAMIAELVRRYWILGMECSLLEIQKLAWLLSRELEKQGFQDILKLKFEAKNYGPYAHNLTHLLNALDGSYLCSDKRIPDSDPLDVIRFNDSKKEKLQVYLRTEAKNYLSVLEKTAELIEGFESPYGMELLATVDWLLYKEKCDSNIESIKKGLSQWQGGAKWAARKLSLFKDHHVNIAIDRLASI
ncbi:macro domain-containing protein [Xenorhabdus sp. DI]|uniref:type II toxin-antitoxin system antitoxin DNA ADP-ribosyl glycohydrolase DarG n=1 Tax=Xenorhabdus doucetiae TaxID=351671 RepID=UPI00199900C8|nr:MULTISPECIES: macro domain-containing protein [unclassified Xenorhabdus]MBD2785057.1 macro domain-containing protein [Xenorhabdus sp. 3]MBD2787301.1 macro domain-containing protein [Xenorhabdus sp. DI]MBD2796184.1 macro domain-containing protein [Xenorhabdus sp. 18]